MAPILGRGRSNVRQMSKTPTQPKALAQNKPESSPQDQTVRTGGPTQSSTDTDKQSQTHRRLAKATKEHFGLNLVFAFTVASAVSDKSNALGEASGTSEPKVETLIITKGRDERQKAAYSRWLTAFGKENGGSVVHVVEIVTLARLDEALANAGGCAGRSAERDDADDELWTRLLVGAKRGIVGDRILVSQYAERARESWRARRKVDDLEEVGQESKLEFHEVRC